MSRVRVFVYGTLMSGRGNNRVLGIHAKLLGHGYIRGYNMFDLGAFPAVVYASGYSKDNGLVHGELWEIDCPALEHVDRLEGTPHFYKREKCYVSLGDPSVESHSLHGFKQPHDGHEAYTYIYQCEGGDKRRSRGIPCGDWRKHVKTLREIAIALAQTRANECP